MAPRSVPRQRLTTKSIAALRNAVYAAKMVKLIGMPTWNLTEKMMYLVEVLTGISLVMELKKDLGNVPTYKLLLKKPVATKQLISLSPLVHCAKGGRHGMT
mmetsp:Transcript_37724/g.79013  ORF Transcript_37724/g.79013 Transcript_37724/m.79013 type:complete len:101 (+) Transcript_37724:891-1193(+)